MSVLRRTVLFCCLAMLALAPVVQAQVTTGNLAGVVKAADGSALPGVTIEAIHTPTGTRYSDVTDGDGRFHIQNVRVGGPYTVTANLEGFKTAEAKNVTVNLGTTAEVPMTLQLTTVSESITVTATTDDIINPNKTGSTSSVSQESIETLPTVNRSLQDFARTNPYFVVDSFDASSTQVNVAGRNNRYNSIQIDGAANNDLFGLAASGTPGGQTDAQPISIDAIQQLQLVVSPYDVRQGGFTGGGINAVTRSGTNKFSGSFFGGRRSPELVGDGPYDQPISDFKQDQYGGRIGGPILHDKLFFFVSGERNKKTQPTGFSADGSSGISTNATVTAGAARLRSFLMSKYNYDPGSLADFGTATDSDLLFGRVDWNATNNHQLTLRHNYVKAGRDIAAGRGSTRWVFETATYTQADETNSTVAQLNSVFGANAYNEARIGLQSIKDARTTPVRFPTVEIGGTGPGSPNWIVGTEQFSHANSLDQDVMELTDDFTFIRGDHTITVGTHNEFFEFSNVFLAQSFGYYYFPTLDAFEAGTPQRYDIRFSTTSDPLGTTKFKAGQYGLYANDSWRANDQLSLTFGLRVDKPDYPDAPAFNQALLSSRIARDSSNIPSQRPSFSPRIGFNWQPTAGGNQQVRGGVGIFQGRTPYVWVSNAYANTGIATVALSCQGTCVRPAFNPDPDTQPRNLGAGAAVAIDLVDPNFNFPKVLRATLGYDRTLPLGIRASVEGLISKTMEDVFYYNVNREATGTFHPLDGRPQYKVVSSAFDVVTLMSNTGRGDETTFTLSLNRPFSNGLILGANYAHQDANSTFDSTSSQAISNWRFRHTKGDIYAHDISRSAFEIEHRANLSATYNFSTGPLAHSVGLFYNVQSGRPYSILMGSSGADMNGDGQFGNDLLYIPAPDQVIYEYSNGSRAASPEGVTPAQAFANYLNFVGVSPTEGRITDRYEFSEPWTRQLDLHYAIELPITMFRTELSMDVQNLLAMVNKDWGIVKGISNQNVTPVQYRGVDAATGKYIYREASAGQWAPGSQFGGGTAGNTLRSRWQARLGVRVSF